jgi:hypothetical protein
VHPQLVAPEGLVAKGVEAKDLLPLRDQRRLLDGLLRRIVMAAAAARHEDGHGAADTDATREARSQHQGKINRVA